MTNIQLSQQKYVSEWHDSFVRYISGLFGYAEVLAILPNATDADKQAIDQIKLILHGKDAKEIEQTLAEGKVKNDTLDKIEKLNKDLTDFAVDQMTVTPLSKEFLKKLSYSQIEQNKHFSSQKLLELQIPIQL